MAMSTQSRKQSKKLVMSLLVVLVLGWLILFGWALSLWVRFGFDHSWQRVHHLSKQQSMAIAQFNEASVASHLTSLLERFPSEQLSSKVTEVRSTIHEELQNVLPDNQLITGDEFNNITKDVFQITRQIWLLMGITGHVMLIKLTILLAAIPLFALTMTAGLVDGLNQRAIRTASLGRESSYVFHQLNHLFKRGLIMLLALWLAIPISITPALMFVPVSILLSVMVSITASRFKKYL